MNLIDDLLATLPDGSLQEVRIGTFWMAVIVETEGQLHCGLASTVPDEDHHHGWGEALL